MSSRALNVVRNEFTRMITRSQVAAFSTNDLKIQHDQKAQEFRTILNDKKAFLTYHTDGKTIFIDHTEVPAVFRGKGVAKLLVLEAFEYVAQNNLKMRIYCDYAEKVFKDNQEKYLKLKL